MSDNKPKEIPTNLTHKPIYAINDYEKLTVIIKQIPMLSGFQSERHNGMKIILFRQLRFGDIKIGGPVKAKKRLLHGLWIWQLWLLMS